jgi:hypothetical protein
VLDRARQLLGELAVQHVARPRISRRSRGEQPADPAQLKLFVDPSTELATTLLAARLDEMSPIQAFDLLRQLQQKLKSR